ncbi:hypothetical protein [Cellulomonas palmilytica]|uniref:hypothetical protein n=1 Tax=Cellulomonas palmilytica TaxID=2608402 RepID=UPI001F22AAF2|nr:hypothetical protein [Cellulomonas palmilytica]UJP40437.1 hypothetical protein F1D97_02595 [Cellulomonas palmilytica]
MRAITRSLAAATSVALALTLAACGTSSAGSAATADPTGAATTAAEPTTSPAADDAGAPPSYTSAELVSVLAAIQPARSMRATSTTSASGMTVTSESAVVNDGDTIAVESVSEQGGETISTVFVDGVFYMSLGEMTQGKFVEIDPTDTTNPLAAYMPDIDSLAKQGSIPLSEEMLISSEDLGVEEVQGVTTRHYRLVLDTTAYMSVMQDASAPELAEVYEQMPKTLEAEYWFDEDYLAVQSTVEVMGTSTTVVLRDWNDPGVTVTAPAADEVISWSEFEALAEAAAGA